MKMSHQCTAGGFEGKFSKVFYSLWYTVFWALHGTVDQDGEVGGENIVLILLYLCCLVF